RALLDLAELMLQPRGAAQGKNPGDQAHEMFPNIAGELSVCMLPQSPPSSHSAPLPGPVQTRNLNGCLNPENGRVAGPPSRAFPAADPRAARNFAAAAGSR